MPQKKSYQIAPAHLFVIFVSEILFLCRSLIVSIWVAFQKVRVCMPLRSTFSHVNRMNFKGACNYDKKIPVPLPAKTSTVPPLYWSTPNYYYRNLSDNHPLETIYSLLFYFPYKATADCLCRKTARSLSKEMKFYHGNRADIGSSFACLRGRTCFGSLCCARRLPPRRRV